MGLTASHISATGPTRLSSGRDNFSATSLGKTSMEIDQVEILSSIGLVKSKKSRDFFHKCETSGRLA